MGCVDCSTDRLCKLTDLSIYYNKNKKKHILFYFCSFLSLNGSVVDWAWIVIPLSNLHIDRLHKKEKNDLKRNGFFRQLQYESRQFPTEHMLITIAFKEEPHT